MVSGLFSAKTVVHLSTAAATASFEHAVAVCTETPALNTSTTALIPRRVCIISSLISSATLPVSVRSPLFHAPACSCIRPARLKRRRCAAIRSRCARRRSHGQVIVGPLVGLPASRLRGVILLLSPQHTDGRFP